MSEIYPISCFTEPVSCWTHLFGAGVFLVLGIFLIRRGAKDPGHFFSLAIFVFSCVFLLSMSGVYHLVPREGASREVLQRLDHAAIYMLIAGTITAVHCVYFTGIWRWGAIALAWCTAVLAIVLKIIYFASFPEWLGLLTYLAFGWLGVISGLTLTREYGFSVVRPLFYGGVAYTAGALLEFYRAPMLIQGVVGPHEIFHVAVLLGLSFHWQFIHSGLAVENAPKISS